MLPLHGTRAGALAASLWALAALSAGSQAAAQDAPSPGAPLVTGEAHAEMHGEVHTDVHTDVRVQVDTRAASEAAAHAAVSAIPILPVRLRAGLAFGGLGAEGMRLLGPSLSLSAGADVDVASFFALGARAQYTFAGGIGDARPFEANYFGGATIFRLWNDRASRQGFSLELGAGYLMVGDHLAPSGLVLDVALARLAGAEHGDGPQAWGSALVVRGQQGVGATSGYRALSLGLEVDIDLNLPGAGGGHTGPAPLRYVVGADAYGGVAIGRDGARDPGRFSAGFGAWAGFPLGPVFEPRLRLDAVRRAGGDAPDSRYGYGASAGLRVRFDRWSPLYVEAHGGYAWLTEGDAGAYADFGAGLRLTPCKDSAHFAVLLGARGRLGFGDASSLSGVFATLGVEYVGGRSYARPRCVEAPPEQVTVVVSAPPEHVVVSAPPEHVVVSVPVETHVQPQPQPQPQPAASGEVEDVGGGVAVRFPFRLSIEPVFGWLDARTPVNHFAAGFALPVDVQITRWLALGVRFGVITGSDVATDLNLDALDDANERDFTAVQVSAGPRFTLWTDEASHEGWDFELGGGWMGRGSRLDGPGFLAEAAVQRRVGGISEGGTSGDVSLGLRYQQGFGQASDFRALLFTMRAGFGLSQPLPEVEPDTTPGFSYTLGLHGSYGLPFAAPGPLSPGSLSAVGLSFGLPIGPWLEARLRADLVQRSQGTLEAKNQSSMLSYAGAGLLRLRLDRVAPLYFEAGAGYAANIGTLANYVPDAPFAVFGGGFRVTFCQSDSALEAGIEGRVGLGDNRGVDGIFFTFGGELAGGRRTIGEGGFWCRFAHRRVEQEARDAERRTVPRPLEGGTFNGGGTVGGSIGGGGTVGGTIGGGGTVGGSTVGGSGTLYVAPPPPPQPIVVEVLLGVSLFGGALNLQISPSMLPLARLAGAARVELRLEGPAASLASAEARVRAVIDADGKRIDAIARVATNSSQVRAVFTIWPPGAR